MRRGLSSPVLGKNTAEVCAHPRRRRRRSICPISADTGARCCAFCCIFPEPECGGRSGQTLPPRFRSRARPTRRERSTIYSGLPTMRTSHEEIYDGRHHSRKRRSTMGVAIRPNIGVVRTSRHVHRSTRQTFASLLSFTDLLSFRACLSVTPIPNGTAVRHGAGRP
jgi:hypothetical protein